MTLVASTGRHKYANAMANGNNNNKCMKQAREEQNSDKSLGRGSS